jgi:hypothetical protein
MISEQIRELQRAVPFQPYTVVTNDGAKLFVRDPDYLLITPNNRTAYIYSNETEREIVAVPNITRIVPGSSKPASRLRPRRR